MQVTFPSGVVATLTVDEALALGLMQPVGSTLTTASSLPTVAATQKVATVSKKAASTASAVKSTKKKKSLFNTVNPALYSSYLSSAITSKDVDSTANGDIRRLLSAAFDSTGAELLLATNNTEDCDRARKVFGQMAYVRGFKSKTEIVATTRDRTSAILRLVASKA